MSTLQQLDDHIIERYTAQPTRLPAELRRQIEHAWQGAPVQLYALADLDQSLVLAETWFALGPRHIAVAKRDSEGWDVRSIERAGIEAVREAPGLSANTLTILGAPGEPALALLRYTHRQRRAFENIRFVLEEQVNGHPRELADGEADRLYAESVARPVRDAQAHGQLDHARLRRYRQALGVPGVRRGGRVALAGAAAWAWNGSAHARLEARLGDDAADPGVLLGDLPARRKHQPVVHPGVAQVVARDGCVVGYDPRHPGREGVQSGGPGDCALRGAKRGCHGGVQPHSPFVDHVLAAAHPGRARDDRDGVDIRGAAAAWHGRSSARGHVRLVPALHDDVPRADRRDRADGAHDQPGDDVGASRIRGARYRARDPRCGGAGAARAGARPGDVRARDVRLRRRPPGAAWREPRRRAG